MVNKLFLIIQWFLITIIFFNNNQDDVHLSLQYYHDPNDEINIILSLQSIILLNIVTFVTILLFHIYVQQKFEKLIEKEMKINKTMENELKMSQMLIDFQNVINEEFNKYL